MAERQSITDRLESMNRLMTVKELAEVLAMSKSTLYERAKRGTIPAINTGGSDIRFDPYAIAQWLKSRAA